jgi:hypothetical protein
MVFLSAFFGTGAALTEMVFHLISISHYHAPNFDRVARVLGRAPAPFCFVPGASAPVERGASMWPHSMELEAWRLR